MKIPDEWDDLKATTFLYLLLIVWQSLKQAD
jgi:hypothetical protein